MNYQTQKKLARAIVRQMNGDEDRVREIIKTVGNSCKNCGGRMVKAKYHIEEKRIIQVLLCTDCKSMYKNGKEINQ